ncbi:Conserved_hypothetical protein [Hexamita inflata]|uniref:Myb-like DNA-binding domain-containing protein n=1 Tax=Hexamita inflata TaxID=28002 RepID=A0AA86TSI1_9EUKA|nr:Conserved hypothetical protein [Hexamita inflata]
MSTRVYTKWTQKEKSLLKQLVKQHSDTNKYNWIEISDIIHTRTPRQCYDQYILLFKTDKSGERHQWNNEEEHTLTTLFKQNPYNWKTIQQNFKQLSIRQLKNKYNQLARTQKCQLIPSNSNTDTQTESSLNSVQNVYKMTEKELSEETNEQMQKYALQQSELGELAQFLASYLDL